MPAITASARGFCPLVKTRNSTWASLQMLHDSQRAAGSVALQRDQGRHPLYGVRGTLKSIAMRLSTELVLLGSSSSLRDYAGGACLEDAARFPEFRNESSQLDIDRNAQRVRHERAGEPSLELLLVGTRGTRLALSISTVAAPRVPACTPRRPARHGVDQRRRRRARVRRPREREVSRARRGRSGRRGARAGERALISDVI